MSGNPIYLYLLVSLSALGGLLFGYDIGVMSGALLLIKEDIVGLKDGKVTR